MNKTGSVILIIIGLSIHYELKAQFRMQSEPKNIKLADIRWRDMCILPDPATQTYYMGKTGKLYMTWTSGGYEGYTCGIAISESGKLAGPWKQQDEPLYKNDGGHGMIFKTFEGKMMLILHSPNNMGSRPRIFELEDNGNTLAVVKEFTE